MNNQQVNLMIDTGSPVTVMDSVYHQKFENGIIKFDIEQQEFTIQV